MLIPALPTFLPPNRQSLKSMQSLDFVETLNFREGNDILYHLQGQLASGFKPRSHEGNDTRPGRMKPQSQVSIHVPTRGTTILPFSTISFQSFQSTFPRGERLASPLLLYTHVSFQSTFPRGERQNTVATYADIPLFQSTFPRGERQR